MLVQSLRETHQVLKHARRENEELQDFIQRQQETADARQDQLLDLIFQKQFLSKENEALVDRCVMRYFMSHGYFKLLLFIAKRRSMTILEGVNGGILYSSGDRVYMLSLPLDDFKRNNNFFFFFI